MAAKRFPGVEHAGEQRQIFKSGRADGVISLETLAGEQDLYALGPVEGLDGEITIFNSRPYVSRLCGGGDAYIVERSFGCKAIFLAWARMREWIDAIVPDAVTDYGALESFVAKAGAQRGMEAPFPFLMAGRPRGLAWHINVDRTGGRPVTQELFRKSKQPYALEGETIDIFGVYSDRHGGVFMGQDMKIHVHFVSRDSKAAGHIDGIDPAGMTLRLPVS